MKRYSNIKKLTITLVLLLLGCDVSMLFAAQENVNGSSNDNATQQQQLQQVLQLQQQQSQQKQLNASRQMPAMAQNEERLAPPPPAFQTQSNAGPTTIPVPPQFPTPSESAQAPAFPQVNQNQFGQQAAPPQPALATPQLAQEQPPPTPPGTVSEEEVNNAAFGAMTKNLLPMTPEQIQRLRQLFNQSQYAAAALPTTPARAVISSQFVNLAPGTTPPVIRLQEGMVSVLTFLDSTGAPWPIQAYDLGNPSAFNMQWNKKDNTLMIQPMSPYPYGNLAIILQGLSTPLILTLTAGQKAFDARLDLHVQGLGPNATTPTVVGLPQTANPNLLCVLDGVPPAGSSSLKVSGGKVQAWLCNGKLFIRTRYTILSPGWLATMSSADGMKAYEMPSAPLLLATQNGKIIQIKIEGR